MQTTKITAKDKMTLQKQNWLRQKREWKIQTEFIPNLKYQRDVSIASYATERKELNEELAKIEKARHSCKAPELHKLRVREVKAITRLDEIKVLVDAKDEVTGLRKAKSKMTKLQRSHQYHRMLEGVLLAPTVRGGTEEISTEEEEEMEVYDNYRKLIRGIVSGMKPIPV